MPRVSDSPLPTRKTVPLDVWRIGASGVASVIGFSALIPFGAIRLEALGHSAAEIGFFSALPWLAILVVAPFVTVLARLFGGARLYVHGAEQPCLIVNDLKLEPRTGGGALWVGPGTEGYFRNLKITGK